MFASPKKYHPTIVEDAKKNIQIAIKISPNLPYTREYANWLNSAPVYPPLTALYDSGSALVVTITSAVMVNTMNVSINTPIIATYPCCTG